MNAISARWNETLARKADATAIFASDGATLRTFGDIESDASRLAKILDGFPPRSVVAIQIGNHPIWPALLLACFRAQLIPLPLGIHIETAERDLALRTCGARGSVTARTNAELTVSEVPAEKIVTTSDIPAETEFLKLTSGTSATPRAIRFRSAQLVADCDNICATMDISDRDRNFGVIPLSHSYGFSNLVTPLLCCGVPLVVSDDRMPRAILDALAASRATVFSGMPILFQKIAEIKKRPPLPDLRLCISAGAPLTASVSQPFFEKFALKIHPFYGSSECGGISYDASETMAVSEGFVGTPMQNVRVEPLDNSPETRIAIRSEAVGDGYFPESEIDDALANGQFIPNDLIRWDADGIGLVGRTTDIINVAGRKLNPLEVEAQLARFPGVRQVVVFGVSSSLRHEEAVAYVVANGEKGTLDPDALMQFARTVLSAWQVPKAIRVVDEIPVNERGKIVRRELAQRYLTPPR